MRVSNAGHSNSHLQGSMSATLLMLFLCLQNTPFLGFAAIVRERELRGKGGKERRLVGLRLHFIWCHTHTHTDTYYRACVLPTSKLELFCQHTRIYVYINMHIHLHLIAHRITCLFP